MPRPLNIVRRGTRVNSCRGRAGTYLGLRQVLAIFRVAWVADLIKGVYDGVLVGLREGYSQLDRVVGLRGSERNEAIRHALDVLVKDEVVEVRSIHEPQVDKRQETSERGHDARMKTGSSSTEGCGWKVEGRRGVLLLHKPKSTDRSSEGGGCVRQVD